MVFLYNADVSHQQMDQQSAIGFIVHYESIGEYLQVVRAQTRPFAYHHTDKIEIKPNSLCERSNSKR